MWGSFEAAAEAWDQQRPEAAIVDPALMGDDPVQALRALGARSDVPLLLFSRRLALDYVHLLVTSGARGVIGTAASGDAVLGATRTVVALQRYVPLELQAELMERMLAAEPPAYLVLSPRERQVVRQAATGQSVATIARALVVSQSTVKTHLRAAYDKLDVHDRASAALALNELGMLPAGPPARNGARSRGPPTDRFPHPAPASRCSSTEIGERGERVVETASGGGCRSPSARCRCRSRPAARAPCRGSP